MRAYRKWAAGVVLAALVAGAAVPQEPKPKFTPEQRAKLKERNRWAQEAIDLDHAGRLDEAVAAAEKMLAIELEVFGETHPDVSDSCMTLGRLHRARGDWPAARTAGRRALDIRIALHGKADWRVTDARLALADVDVYQILTADDRKAARRAEGLSGEGTRLYREGKYADAAERYEQCLAIWRKALGADHPATATALNNLAVVYLDTGQYAKAVPLHQQALAIRRKALGADHPSTAQSLSNLAELYRLIGQYAKAEPLHQQALAIRRKALGADDPETATTLNNLALLYRSIGQYAKAEPLHQQALAIRRKALGADHPSTATTLNNLAVLYCDTGEYAKAELHFQESLAIRRKVLGADHPSTAISLNNLALLYRTMGQNAKAEPLYVQTLAIWKKTLGADHPDTATALNNLAVLYEAMGQYAKAEPLTRQALATSLAYLDQTADVQPEQGQIAFAQSVRHILAVYLAATSDLAGHAPADAYGFLLRWKGQVFARQRRQRELARAANDPETARTAADLLAVTRQLATLAGQTPKPAEADAWQKRLKELDANRENLETELVKKSVAFRKQKERETLAPGQVRALLPPETALVDFFVYWHLTPNPKAKGGCAWEERLIAFVVRPDREVVRVELGPFVPVAEAVENWRKDTKRRRPVRKTADGDDDPDDPAVVLRDKLWLPVAKHLGGVQTVLVSPDRDLSKLPFGALPGAKDGTYLIEDLAVAVLPVAQFLPDLLAPPAKADPSLLVVGAVDYGADPGKPAAGSVSRGGVRGDRGSGWKPLPATRGEATAVAGSFGGAFPGGRTKVLRDAEPTEEAIRGLLGKHRWVHLATHGFFADPSVRSAAAGPSPDRVEGERGKVTGQLPGLLSGVVLAGANRPAEVLSGGDDGILTAAEVSTLDLSGTEVVVLSACETGLGQVAGGEGVLGLQRAFQVAGCRTTVTSLWTVDDDATRRLMERAYAHWWGGKTTKLEGLVEAQRWMLKEGAPGGKGKAPPFYWAAFTLAGDWR